MQIQTLIDQVSEAVSIVDRYGLGDMAHAEVVLAQARHRLGLSQEHTVIALAGTTGSGKSTLFNALVGHEVATPGVKRPTTGEPLAVIFGGLDEAAALLDALEVHQRHYVEVPPPEFAGLVLIDLPDFDSFERSNRAQAMRLIGLVDAIVWVTDPQKYADASLHQDFLSPMRSHAAVLDVVLNQADRLQPGEGKQVLADLERLLAEDGLAQVEPLALSALTGDGVGALRLRIGARVLARQAMVQRVEADVLHVVHSLPGALVQEPTSVEKPALVKAMTPDLAAAIGADQVAQAIRNQTKRQVFLAAGWPPVRWIQRWRKIPVAQVTQPGVSSLAEAHVAAALRAAGEVTLTSLGSLWATPVKTLTEQARTPLRSGLDQASSRTLSLPDALPGWVRWLHIIQLVGVMAFGIGLGWVASLRIVGGFLFVDQQVLRDAAIPLGPFPLPTWLVFVGLGIGLIASLLAVVGGQLLARQRGQAATAQLVGGIDKLIDTQVVLPLLALTRDARSLHTITRSYRYESALDQGNHPS